MRCLLQATLTTILAEVKKRIDYKGGRECLRRLLIELGFRCKTLKSNKKILIEKLDIGDKQLAYLRKNEYVRKGEGPIIFIDETFIHTLQIKADRPMALLTTHQLARVTELSTFMLVQNSAF